jgi:hypothetical protein
LVELTVDGIITIRVFNKMEVKIHDVLMKGPIFDYSERGKETSGIKNLGNILQI